MVKLIIVGGFKLLVEVFLDCKESVYGVIEYVDKAYERYLNIQMDFVLTAKIYCFFLLAIFSGIQEVLIPLQ